jgi:hypothetical protein
MATEHTEHTEIILCLQQCKLCLTRTAFAPGNGELCENCLPLSVLFCGFRGYGYYVG